MASLSTLTTTTVKPGRGSRWLLLSLLVISVCINYIDRGNLSVAATAVSRDLEIDPQKIGLLLSAFFLTYALFQVVAGWAIDRFNVLWVYTVGFVLWSLATAATGLSSGLITLLCFRLILGIAESVAYPSYSKILVTSFSETERGTANSLIDAGSKLGPALGLMLGAALVGKFGWRGMFIGIGGGSLLWLIPWILAVRAEPDAAKISSDSHGPGFADILREKSAWGTFGGLFCANYAWYFLLTWLPWYLERERHYSVQAMGQFGSLVFWAVAAASIISGWASDRLIAHGFTPNHVRKTFVMSGLGLMCIFLLPAVLVNDRTIALMLLIASGASFGLFSSNVWAVTQTLAGRQAAGKWTGLQNMFGNLAGVIAPFLTGFIVVKTGEFFYAFVAVCAALAIGVACYGWGVRSIEPVSWNNRIENL